MGKEYVVYLHNRTLLSHKKEWNLAICDNMDGLRGYYAKCNKLDKDIYHMISLICGLQKTKQMNKRNKTETDSQI